MSTARTTPEILRPARAPKLARRAHLRLDRHTGRHLLLYPERGLILNKTAAAIAAHCDGTRTAARIVDELVATHAGATREEITRDVDAFLDELAERGLLEGA